MTIFDTKIDTILFNIACFLMSSFNDEKHEISIISPTGKNNYIETTVKLHGNISYII